MDREVLKIFNLKIYNEEDFKFESGRAVISFEKSRKLCLGVFKSHNEESGKNLFLCSEVLPFSHE